jgi:hypothetical protein
MVRFAAVVLLVVLAGRADAQQDVTPPELLEFWITPVVLDTGEEDVSVEWCATFRDDRSGLDRINVQGFLLPFPESGLAVNLGGQRPEVGEELAGTICGMQFFPQFSPYGIWGLNVDLTDGVGRQSRYFDPAVVVGPLDLCAVGPCRLSNRSASGLPDTDEDGTPNDADNCPADPNADQADLDLDWFGDACDLCPDYRSPNNADFDDNGIGDVCECGDQTQDGVVNVVDIVSINLAIFGAVQVSPLCDTNNDGKCNVQDIVGANYKIFGRPAYCSRYPPPDLQNLGGLP